MGRDLKSGCCLSNRIPFYNYAVLNGNFGICASSSREIQLCWIQNTSSRIEPSLLDSSTIDELARSGGARNSSGSGVKNGRAGVQVSVVRL
jgi:hypothetical protein